MIENFMNFAKHIQVKNLLQQGGELVFLRPTAQLCKKSRFQYALTHLKNNLHHVPPSAHHSAKNALP